VAQPTHAAERDLLGLVGLTDFLVRTGQHGAAVAAVDRLGDALLAYYRNVGGASPAADGLRREALRLWADVTVLGRRLRLGPVRRPPALRRRVESLLLAELTATLADDRRRLRSGAA
jgi:hypothetical protein